MNIPQLTALCLRYQGVLLDASEEVVHVAVVDAPSHELLDALHFATTKRIEITCWTRQQMEGHASRTQPIPNSTASKVDTEYCPCAIR